MVLLFHIVHNINSGPGFVLSLQNSVDADQLASSEAN